jgi:hypothetical protein
MSIASLFAGSAFDPDTVALFASAFDTAWDTLKTSRSPLAVDGQADSTRELLAKHIIEMAQKGERDGQRLANEALAHLALAKLR